jgi:cytochrome c oxidase assembly protein subunit 15
MTDAADWEAEFAAYREIPEYQLQNRGMSLAEFKVIYWWEWGHRQLGRVIGLVWAVGFVGFLLARNPAGWTGALRFWALGGAQGAIGWWMVASGLAPGRCWTWRLPAGDASGSGLRDPWADRVVRLAAGPRGGAT